LSDSTPAGSGQHAGTRRVEYSRQKNPVDEWLLGKRFSDRC
jgi:hypothetical protein